MSTAPEVSLVDDDLLCNSCGYNLRGLAPDGNCPECGMPIERSQHGDRLVYADPQWLQRVVRGHTMIAWGINAMVTAFALFLMWFIALILDTFVQEWALLNWMDVFIGFALTIVSLLLLAGGLLCAIGVVPLTRVDPRESATEANFSPRRVVRATFGFLIVFVAAWQALSILPATTTTIGQPIVRGFAYLVIGALAIIGFRAFIAHLIGLLQRIPNHSVIESLRNRRKLITIAAALTVIWSATITAAPTGPGGMMVGGAGQPTNALETVLLISFMTIGCTGPVAFLTLIFYILALARTLRRSQRVLRAVREQQDVLQPAEA